MKKIFFILISMTCTVFFATAQNVFLSTGSTGIGTATPNASSILEIKSTGKGILVPRMTKALRDAIAVPATGLLIYQTNNTPGFYYYSGTSWTALNTPGVNTSLSNLNSPTQVNANLLPDSNNLRDLGSEVKGWKNIFASGSVFLIGIKTLNVAGNGNLFLGQGPGLSNTTGSNNTAMGTGTFSYNTAGTGNTANGEVVLSSNTTGNYNTATGSYALLSNTTGNNNTASGRQSLSLNTTGANNTATGDHSLYFNSGANDNVGDGFYTLFYSIGSSNTAAGGNALFNNTTGNYNTAAGFQALYNIITGSYNTAIGYNAGPAVDLISSTALGAGSQTTYDNQVRIGDGNITSIGGFVDWTNISDGRVKKNIKQNVPGLGFIKKLQPITYNLDLDAADAIVQRPAIKDKEGKIVQPSADEIKARNQKEAIVYTGFIAQDVEKAAQSINYHFSGVDAAKNSKDLYGLSYSDFVVPLVKAVQELSKRNSELSKQNEAQKKQIDELKTIMISANQNNTSDIIRQNKN